MTSNSTKFDGSRVAPKAEQGLCGLPYIISMPVDVFSNLFSERE